MKSSIVFADDKVKKSFEKILDKQLKKQIEKAIENLQENAFCGIHIPKEYVKRFGRLNNLWKYNLPDAWRLIYTVKNNNIEILSVLLEWLDHKEYEKRFNY